MHWPAFPHAQVQPNLLGLEVGLEAARLITTEIRHVQPFRRQTVLLIIQGKDGVKNHFALFTLWIHNSIRGETSGADLDPVGSASFFRLGHSLDINLYNFWGVAYPSSLISAPAYRYLGPTFKYRPVTLGTMLQRERWQHYYYVRIQIHRYGINSWPNLGCNP